MLCYVMLCYVMLCYVMLCYVMLCYVMLYCGTAVVYAVPRYRNIECGSDLYSVSLASGGTQSTALYKRGRPTNQPNTPFCTVPGRLQVERLKSVLCTLQQVCNRPLLPSSDHVRRHHMKTYGKMAVEYSSTHSKSWH